MCTSVKGLCLETGYGNQKHCDFCSFHDIRVCFFFWIDKIYRQISFCKKNIAIFRESLAKT